MKIQWLGHSAFRITESTGSTVITDPFKPAAVGYAMAYASADAVTLSHNHSDHNFVEGVKGKPVVISTPGNHDFEGISVNGISCFHDEVEGKKRGENIIYKFSFDGVTVCHLGDVGELCSPELIEQLVPVNVLLLPVGGNYTVDAEQAKEYVDRIMPDVVIPMHYKTKHCEMDIDRLDAFLKLFDDESIVELDSDTVEFDRGDFNGESTKIIVPQRYKG